MGFNTGSVGVAVIGTFESGAIPAAAEASLEKLLAWRLDLAHVDPLSTLSVVSGGSEKVPAGIPVFLRAVSGHRDTGLTSCPGDFLYGAARRDRRRRRSRIGLPKLFEPKVTGGLGGPVRFRARVSGTQAWRVVVAGADGQELAAGAGQGPTVDWTWDASLVAAPGVRWRVEVAGATPLSGTIGKAAAGGPPPVAGISADPETISPNDDGAAESSTITYTTTVGGDRDGDAAGRERGPARGAPASHAPGGG